MSENKYVVFKWREFESFMDQLTEAVAELAILLEGKPEDSLIERLPVCPNPLGDAVVIRRQDVFAPPALDAYANAITAALTIFEDLSGHIPGVDEPAPASKKLRSIADYFAEQAAMAWDTNRKLPD